MVCIPYAKTRPVSKNLVDSQRAAKDSGGTKPLGQMIIIQLVSKLYSGVFFTRMKKNIKSPGGDFPNSN